MSPWRRLGRVCAWVLSVLCGLWVLLRLSGVDPPWPVSALLAFTPWVVVPALVAPRLLLGDFNATLDHAALRRLIGSGYRDAADAVGAGLRPTWPADVVPVVTLDHVLVDSRIGVRSVTVHAVPGTDHRAVVAVLAIPG
jgi:endonuclease/exonuclease/phosphatase family metal-dependent hydrolase